MHPMYIKKSWRKGTQKNKKHPNPPELHNFDKTHLKSELESLNLLFNKLWNSKLPRYDLFALKDIPSTTPIGIAE